MPSSWVGVGSGVGRGVGVAEGVGAMVGLDVGSGVGLGVGKGVKLGVGKGVDIGAGAPPSVGADDGSRVGPCEAPSVGLATAAVGPEVGVPAGLGVAGEATAMAPRDGLALGPGDPELIDRIQATAATPRMSPITSISQVVRASGPAGFLRSGPRRMAPVPLTVPVARSGRGTGGSDGAVGLVGSTVMGREG